MNKLYMLLALIVCAAPSVLAVSQIQVATQDLTRDDCLMNVINETAANQFKTQIKFPKTRWWKLTLSQWWRGGTAVDQNEPKNIPNGRYRIEFYCDNSVLQGHGRMQPPYPGVSGTCVNSDTQGNNFTVNDESIGLIITEHQGTITCDGMVFQQ